jgi:hypothetical protein
MDLALRGCALAKFEPCDGCALVRSEPVIDCDRLFLDFRSINMLHDSRLE